MQYLKNIIIALTILLGLINFAQSETSWIKKKDKKDTVKKVEEKSDSTWIKKKIKEDKKEYKKGEKEITKEVKSWITKKSKDKYIDSIDKLPENAIYFTASNETKDLLVYGYVQPDVNSKLINGFYETSKGFGYFNDGKTTCKIGSTVIDVSSGEVTARVSGECTNGIKFTGKTSQNQNTGMGFAKTEDGINRFLFDFNIQRTEIAKLYKNNLQFTPNSPGGDDINLNIKGKYYALLIGNSNYLNWASLKSPQNDVREIEKVLSSNYNFEKIISIIDGSEKDIMKGFKELSNITTDKDYVLIYYSGHGDNRGINNYWIPVDGEKEFGLGDWINTAEISNYIMQEIPNHHIVLMSDSCYFDVKTKSNQILNDRKSLSYQKLLNRRSIMIVQSGSNEPVLDSDDDKHSMFAKSFINSLKNNETVVRMYDIIEEITLSHSGMRQQPLGFRVKGWGDTGGDFLFVSKNQ
tara:strand:- start:822 stop:2216 length:1395 start_codon:yes stop_codon:yes gene_type:complete